MTQEEKKPEIRKRKRFGIFFLIEGENPDSLIVPTVKYKVCLLSTESSFSNDRLSQLIWM